jgi:hypothetical protein
MINTNDRPPGACHQRDDVNFGNDVAASRYQVLVGLVLRSEVVMTMKKSMSVFWTVPPCGLLDGYQGFRGTYRLYLQGHQGEDR